MNGRAAPKYVHPGPLAQRMRGDLGANALPAGEMVFQPAELTVGNRDSIRAAQDVRSLPKAAQVYLRCGAMIVKGWRQDCYGMAISQVSKTAQNSQSFNLPGLSGPLESAFA
jgi:hypothetical protein